MCESEKRDKILLKSPRQRFPQFMACDFSVENFGSISVKCCVQAPGIHLSVYLNTNPTFCEP